MASAPSLRADVETASERIARLASDPDAVGEAYQRAINRTLRDHKLLGLPVVVDWRDGQVVEIQPEDIPDIPEEDCAPR